MNARGSDSLHQAEGHSLYAYTYNRYGCSRESFFYLLSLFFFLSFLFLLSHYSYISFHFISESSYSLLLLFPPPPQLLLHYYLFLLFKLCLFVSLSILTLIIIIIFIFMIWFDIWYDMIGLQLFVCSLPFFSLPFTFFFLSIKQHPYPYYFCLS